MLYVSPGGLGFIVLADMAAQQGRTWISRRPLFGKYYRASQGIQSSPLLSTAQPTGDFWGVDGSGGLEAWTVFCRAVGTQAPERQMTQSAVVYKSYSMYCSLVSTQAVPSHAAVGINI